MHVLQITNKRLLQHNIRTISYLIQTSRLRETIRNMLGTTYSLLTTNLRYKANMHIPFLYKAFYKTEVEVRDV